MARTGSDPFVEQVRAANDIVDIVGAQVALSQAGARFKGLCPFHQEKTPSFYVSTDHQTYHCFGCGVGGDVYSFVMEQENMSFPEALRYLADRAGIAVPERSGPSREQQDRLEQIRQALKISRDFFAERLKDSNGARAREYLLGRDIGEELWKRYGLGFALDSWDGLRKYATQFVSERTLIEAGLAVENKEGRVYDRFRNRVIVPIESTGGAPVGFGGRILADEEPKYLNSPETAVYRKGSVLFGASQARPAIREDGLVLIVEGYFDVLSLVNAGIECAVGTCGTALTPDQTRQLARYGARIVLLFDGDGAGVRAALRALPIVIADHSDVRVLFPPAGQDPDDWVRAEGRDAVNHAIDHAWTPVAFLEEQVRGGQLPREEGARRAVDLAAKIEDPLSRDLWVQEICGRFGLGEDAVWARLRGELQTSERRSQATRTDGWKPLERVCLQVALEHPDRASDIARAVEAGRPRPEFLAILSWIEAKGKESPPPSPPEMVARARDELPDLPGLSAAVAAEESGPATGVESLIRRLRIRAVRFQMSELTRDIRRAESVGDDEELIRLLSVKQRLTEEQTALDAVDSEDEDLSPNHIETEAGDTVY